MGRDPERVVSARERDHLLVLGRDSERLGPPPEREHPVVLDETYDRDWPRTQDDWRTYDTLVRSSVWLFRIPGNEAATTG